MNKESKWALGKKDIDCLSSDPVAVFQYLLYISVTKNISIYLYVSEVSLSLKKIKN